MAQIFESLGQVWQRASLLNRVLLLTILLACVGAAAILVGWARKPQMSLLYSGLAREDAARVVDKIRDADIPYQLKEGGTTILVPEQEVYGLRLGMASQGLPTGDQAGYRILDTEKIGTSPFSQRVNYIRALEGELARSIRMIDGVVSARVHVVRPDGALFAAQQKQRSATVVVRLKGGKRMTDANVGAIVHLVAGSVEGMSPEHVVVVDGQGNLLSGEDKTELAKGAGTFLDYKSRVEQYLADKAERTLTAVLGPNRASVQVDAVIDTARVSETVETYDPDKKVITREEIKSSSSSPPAGATAGGAKAGEKKEDTTMSEFLVGKTVKEQMDLPGQVKSLSVAVVVDLSPPEKAEGDQGAAPPAPLKKEDVEEIVQKATGATKEDVTVTVASFYKPPEAAEEAPEEGFFNKDFILALARRGSLGVLVIGALLALKLFGASKSKSAAAALEAGSEASGNLLPAGEGVRDADVLRARITRALQDNPEEVKRLFLSWVESEKGEV